MKDPLEEVQITETRGGSLTVLAVIVALLVALFIASPWVAIVIVGIIVLVMAHEAGHFIAARHSGMRATEYFLGFGPRLLWSFTRGETEYGVKAIPAGGYVRIIGMSNLEEVDPADEARSFRNGSTKNRLIVILAGVTVNILIAWLLFTVAIAGQGKVYENKPSATIGFIVAGSAAAKANPGGFEVGDRIVNVAGTNVESWHDIRREIKENGGSETTFVVVRDGRPKTLTTKLEVKDNQGFLGVSPESASREVSLLGAIPEGMRTMGTFTVGMARGIGHIFTPAGVKEYSKNFTGEAKANSKAEAQRPRSLIGAVDMSSASGNVWTVMMWLGLISLALALFNMLPLLPFDGGHAVVVVYEALASKARGRRVRVDFRKLMPATAVVLVVLLTFGLSTMFLDIRDLVR